MKIVLDSNIFVSSFYWAGNPRKVFDRVTNGLDELYITDKILQCGFDGNVDFIITGDNDLLVLKEYKEIKIVKPKEYLDII